MEAVVSKSLVGLLFPSLVFFFNELLNSMILVEINILFSISPGNSLRRFGQSIKRIVREVEEQSQGEENIFFFNSRYITNSRHILPNLFLAKCFISYLIYIMNEASP